MTSMERDTKDWTWVLERPCPECGLDASAVGAADLPAALRANAAGWRRALAAGDARLRPEDGTWSPLEYACHLRDVLGVFRGRVRLMLAEDDPTFPGWDQNVAAEAGRYHESDPAAVADELEAATEALAGLLAGLDDRARRRPGRRGDGVRFTIESLGRYGLHEARHHLYDVGGI